MMTCIKCRQEFSEENHECLDVMNVDELMGSGTSCHAANVMGELAKVLDCFAGVTLTPTIIQELNRVALDCLLDYQLRNGLPEVDCAAIVNAAFEETFKGGAIVRAPKHFTVVPDWSSTDEAEGRLKLMITIMDKESEE